MKWNWQNKNWPKFAYNSEPLEHLERQFQQNCGIMLGALKHVSSAEKSNLIVDLISTEAIKTSEIEGEILNRDSVQSSIKRNFGLDTVNKPVTPAEQGVADMMTNLYQNFDAPLNNDTLFTWHKMLTKGRRDLNDIGRYRTHSEPMQIVSGADYAAIIHFEAPPSSSIDHEMARYIKWFNDSINLPTLIKASIAHLYFESIHPFEDGNGRIGRALTEKALSQDLGQPTLIALSQTIQSNKKSYYRHLELFNKDLEITGWLTYFSQTIIDAQQYSIKLIDFLIAKTKFFDQYKGAMNERQSKAIARMFKEGVDGFKGGLSADNYITITGATRPTATRDLSDLVNKGILTKTGERRYTRYWLNV
jgi:Fic family protein